jgi:DNA polymerase-1
LEKQIYEMTGKRLNLNSPDQISDLLYEKLKLPVQSDKEGKRTTDDGSLIKLMDAHPVVGLIRQYRSSFKIYTSYVLGLSDLLDDGRLYTNYLVHGARTGRLASADPNLQNIPVKTDQGKKIRACFIPDDGCKLGPFDFSQIELRVLGCYSRDPILLDAYFTGKDIHRKTASVAFQMPLESIGEESNERQAGKTLNFGIIYGMTEHGLVNALKGHWKPGNEYLQAKEFIKRYFDEYRGVDALVKKVHADLEITQEVVNMFGRKRRFPNIQTATGGLKRYLLRQCFNAYIQGTASDITSLALIRVNSMLKKEGYSTRPILDVHDEIIFNIPKNEIEVCEKIAEIMIEPVGTMDIPLEVNHNLHDCWEK